MGKIWIESEETSCVIQHQEEPKQQTRQAMKKLAPMKDTTRTGTIFGHIGTVNGTSEKISKGRYRGCRPWR